MIFGKFPEHSEITESCLFKPKHSMTEQKQAGQRNLFQCEYKLFRLITIVN